MELPFYQVDAFTDKVFGGNPAAVVPFTEWPDDALLRAITLENNLSETAFFVKRGSRYELRWFTVLEEIDLCGHATLASAYVIFHHLGHEGDEIIFDTRFAGELRVTRQDGYLTLDFPARPPEPINTYPPELITCLGDVKPEQVLLSRDYVVVYSREDDVRGIVPNYALMEKLQRRVCVTAKGKDCDFVSRFFCAGDAMPEDPVTGSSHCSLVPYWAARLGKTDFIAKQLSPRGGTLLCRLAGGRVFLSGRAALYLVGKIFV